VSTDFNESDRLYFEPLTLEDVLNVIDKEQPLGVMVQFGGQTAINLAQGLVDHGVKILGTPLAGLNAAEDRRLFDRVLEDHGLQRPAGQTAVTTEEARRAAESIGYPLLVRPSFVLGGRAMEIVEDREQLERYLERLSEIGPEQPLLVDRYLNGLELEVDAVSDGEHVLIPAVMEHIERAGVHSGDSLAVLPPRRASPELVAEVVRYTTTLCRALQVRGLLNVQFVAANDALYVIEANPRSSRTVPFLIKATGIPLVDLAVETSLGKPLSDRYGYGLVPAPEHWAVKMPVFSFAKLSLVDAALGPEMKSTGEAMGIDHDFSGALYKALLSGGFRLPAQGKILATIADADKEEAVPLLRALADMGHLLYATEGTLARLSLAGVAAAPVYRMGERHPDLVDLIRQGRFNLVVNTITRGGRQESEGFLIRRAAVERGMLCFTSLDTLRAAVTALQGRHQKSLGVHSLNEWLKVGMVQ
jgi:carbamoyl-phosphate synthase large subunit